jgi:hypothetical protein
MLPSWDAILDPTDRPLPATEQLLELGGWPEAEGVTVDLLQRAKELQAMLRDPFSRIGGTPAVAIMTSNKPTKVTMVRLTTAAVTFSKGRATRAAQPGALRTDAVLGWNGVRPARAARAWKRAGACLPRHRRGDRRLHRTVLRPALKEFRMRARCRAALLLTSVVLLPAPPVLALDVSWRLHTALPAQWEPTIGVGLVLRVPLGAAPEPSRTGSGPATLHVRNWFLHAAVAGALNTGDVDTPIGFGQMGVVRRARLGPIDRAGLLVVGSLGQGARNSPAFRGLNGVVGIQPGWMWFEGNRNGPTLTVDISLALIGDTFRH